MHLYYKFCRNLQHSYTGCRSEYVCVQCSQFVPIQRSAEVITSAVWATSHIQPTTPSDVQCSDLAQRVEHANGKACEVIASHVSEWKNARNWLHETLVCVQWASPYVQFNQCSQCVKDAGWKSIRCLANTCTFGRHVSTTIQLTKECLPSRTSVSNWSMSWTQMLQWRWVCRFANSWCTYKTCIVKLWQHAVDTGTKLTDRPNWSTKRIWRWANLQFDCCSATTVAGWSTNRNYLPEWTPVGCPPNVCACVVNS